MSNHNRYAFGFSACILLALVLVAGTACGSGADAGKEAGDDSAAGAGFAAQSDAAGILWSWPAEEIPGLTQQIVGEGAEAVVILHREGEDPSSDAAIYLHSWGASPPNARASHMQGLIRRGYAVIYPVYQLPDTLAEETRRSAIAGIEAAVEELDPNPETLIAIGDVTGGAIAFDYAALARSRGLPVPKLVVAIHPGREPGGLIPPADHSRIPADTKLLIATSSNHRVPDGWALVREMLADASSVPPENRDLFVARPEAGLSTGDAIADSYSKIERAVSSWLDRNGALRGKG